MKAFLGTLLLLSCFAAWVHSTPNPPVWPDAYYVEGVYRVPYADLNEEFECVYDKTNNREKWSFYNGMDVTILFYDTTVAYRIYPKIDVRVCEKTTTDQTLYGALTGVLPDLSQGFKYKGTATVNNIACDNWELLVDNLYNKTGVYNFYVDSATHQPVQFYMNGVDLIFDAHPDIYVIDYKTYIPNYDSDNAFATPDVCSSSQAEAPKETFLHRMKALLGRTIDEIVPVFHGFINKYNKKYHSTLDYSRKLHTFKNNAQFIKEYNAKNTGMTLAINGFADMTDEEFKRVMTPRPRRPENVSFPSAEIYRTTYSNVPDAVDWRAKGAVTPVKDQASCGSCWTFGTVGTLEGMWFVKTGKLIRLSEQQLVDCSRGEKYSNNDGCNGGFADGALQWIIDNGGISSEAEYKYLGQNGYCDSSKKSGVKVQKFVDIESGNERALQEIVGTRGPVAIAIDASPPTFRFFSSGVYVEPVCKNGPNDLDHEVLAVGYGTENGQDYWIVKNSWSTHWGDEGYIKMARNHNNQCGIATQAVYAIL